MLAKEKVAFFFAVTLVYSNFAFEIYSSSI